MSQEKTFETVEDYARMIHAQTHKVLFCLLSGDVEEARKRVSTLCTEAAGIVQAAKMKQEVDAGDFNLSTLPKPKDVAPDEDTESPFYQE